DYYCQVWDSSNKYVFF
nr:immunoglobulin light chain junction region [Macaca mulatta]MOV73650.1 immunoglobulin light chain junction region [Macaca mulatta]